MATASSKSFASTTPVARSTWGNLTQVRHRSGSTRFEYDQRERTFAILRTLQGTSYTTGSRYDAQDRLFLHGYPDGSSVRLRRNQQRGFVTGFGDDSVTFHYEADGREVRRDYAIGSWGHDQLDLFT